MCDIKCCLVAAVGEASALSGNSASASQHLAVDRGRRHQDIPARALVKGCRCSVTPGVKHPPGSSIKLQGVSTRLQIKAVAVAPVWREKLTLSFLGHSSGRTIKLVCFPGQNETSGRFWLSL